MTQRAPAPALSIFVSSPGDVAEERALVERLIERLKARFAGLVALEPVFWEHEPLLATSSFQDQIVLPSETDIVVCVLWARLGTRLPPHITRPDGSRYDSGTEFELEDAARAYRERGRPALMVYRRMEEPRVSLGDEQALLERLAQKKALDRFVERFFHGADGSLSAAFSPYSDLAEFEDRLERHLGKLITELIPAGAVGREASPPPLWHGESPFRGLETFEYQHAPIFFGRTRAIHDVLDALRTQAADGRALVTVLGMSGSGKSSLARAGVLPLLTRPGVIEGVGLWRRATIKPSDAGGDPFAALAAALLDAEALGELAEDGTEPAELAELLRTTPQAALPLLRVGLAQAAKALVVEQGLVREPAARLILLVDQLEELFTHERIDSATRAAFVAALDELARDGRVWVLTTLRSDFLPRCAELPALMALQEGAGLVHLSPPTPAEIGQIVRQPAAAAGLSFASDPETGEGLDEVLRDAAAADPASLPLLEFALEELYRRRDEAGVLTFEAHRELGGVEGALARRAEETYGELPAEARAALPRVLRALVRVGEDGDGAVSRRRADLAAVTATPASRQLVEAFVAARLFATELRGDEAVVGVSHEALLRHWPRLVDWLEQDRESLRVLGRVGAAARRWREEGRTSDLLLQPGKPLEEAEQLRQRWDRQLPPEALALIDASAARARRNTRVKRGLVAALALLAALAVGGAVIASRARDDALLRRAQADDLIGFMLGDLRDKLEPVGRLELLDGVGDKAEDYFASLPVGDLTEADLLRQARALRQIGEVRMAQGDLEAAMAAFERALELARTLAAAVPEDPERLLGLAQSHDGVGRIQLQQGDLEAAAAAFEAYRATAESLLAREPDTPRALMELSYAHANLGATLFERGDLDGALESFRRSAELNERAVALAPGEGRWRQDLADAYAWIGNAQRERGETGESLAAYGKTLTIMEALVAEAPDNTGRQYWLAQTHNNLGATHDAAGDPRRALEHFRRAEVSFRPLVLHDPGNALWQSGLAESFDGAGWTLGQLGDTEAAVAALRRARDVRAPLVAADPSDHGSRELLLLTLFDLAQLLGGSAEAREVWAAVAEHAAVLAEQDGDYVELLVAQAWAALHLERLDEARPLVARLAKEGHDDPTFWDLCRRKGLSPP